MKTIFTLSFFFICKLTIAQYGRYNMLDNTFGLHGKTSTSVTDTLHTEGTTAKSVLLQKDEKIIIAGDIKTGTVSNVLFARFLSDGNLDSTFGNKGSIVYINSMNDILRQAKQQSSGKIVAVIQSGSAKYMIRITSTGIDSSFGIMGRANLNHKGYSLDINEKDEIVVGENLKNNGKLVCGVQQFKKNGIPDSAFGINSFSSITIDNDPMLETESKIKFDKKGNIVIGSTWNRPVGSSLYPYLIVSRFKANGAIDSGFNNTGILVLYKIKSAHLLTALAIQNDNKIVVGAQSGGSLHPEGNFLVVRINENGIVDSSFNKKGFVITDFNYNPNVNPKKYDILSSLIIQPDNKIIAAGSSLQYYGNGGQFALCRYERNGSLDKSFGFRGRVTTKFNFGYEAGCTDAILQQDGKIVLAGYSDTNIDLHSYSNFAIARYNKEKSNAQLFIIENATVKETGTLISVYPVPTSDRLFLTGLHPNDNYIINISSISGEIVFLTKVNQISSYSISVRYLHSGQYFLNIISEQKTISKEFIKH